MSGVNERNGWNKVFGEGSGASSPISDAAERAARRIVNKYQAAVEPYEDYVLRVAEIIREEMSK